MVRPPGVSPEDGRARLDMHTRRADIAPAREGRMHFGAFFYGTVDMPDAGVDGPPAHARNYGQESYRRAYDRWKSTRLNSSHSSISYAVFCLKKKIENIETSAEDRVLHSDSSEDRCSAPT